jgi:hypothetical protein
MGEICFAVRLLTLGTSHDRCLDCTNGKPFTLPMPMPEVIELIESLGHEVSQKPSGQPPVHRFVHPT